MKEIPELWTQFCLADQSVSLNVPESWKSTQLYRWTLYRPESTPFVILSSKSGTPMGWLIGFAMDSAGRRITEDFQSNLDDAQFHDPKLIDELLMSLEGRFGMALVHPDIERYYINSGGDYSAVFRTDIPVVASSPTTAHFDHLDAFVEEQIQKPELLANKYFPAGLTCSADTVRLVPNHYLDLKSRTTHRYWPIEPLIEMSADEHTAVAKHLAADLRNRVEHFASIAPLTCGLTGGRDCRMLLAAGKNVKDRMHFYTYLYEKPDQDNDDGVAKYIARKYKLNHKLIKIVQPPKPVRDEYLFRVGYCNNSGKAGDFYQALKDNYPRDVIMLVGYGGEVLRAQYYRNFTPTVRPDALKVLDIIKQAVTPESIAMMENWLKQVPEHLSVPMVYDLIYWELRFGCWAAPQMYGATQSIMYLSPMTHGKFLRQYVRQQVPDKHAYTMFKKLAGFNWPSMEAIPLNTLVGWDATRQKIKNFPGRVVRKLKKIAGIQPKS